MTPRAPIEYPKCEACKDHGGTAYCPRCVGKAIDSATKALREEIDAAKNLLAVLHRDGGHHTDEVGFIQSCKDGERVWRELVAEVERMHRWQGLAGLRADQAEAAIKPLVEALNVAHSFLRHLSGQGEAFAHAVTVVAAAIAAHEESKK